MGSVLPLDGLALCLLFTLERSEGHLTDKTANSKPELITETTSQSFHDVTIPMSFFRSQKFGGCAISSVGRSGALSDARPHDNLQNLDFRQIQSRVAKIGRDQVEDYAKRRGMSVDEAERWLAPNLAY